MGKLIKSFIRVSLLLLPVSLVLNMSSCIKEEPVQELVDDGSIIFLCEDSKPATKTTLKGLQTEWVEGSDQVGLFSPQASVAIGGNPGVVNEPLTALSSGVRSQFSGSVYWNTGDHDFYSYYPYAAGTPPYTAVPVSLPAGQTQSSGNDSSHIGSLDFLVARPYTAKYPGSDGTPASVSLRYNHLFSIIEFQIIRSSGSGAISKVKLSGKVPLAFDEGFIDISQVTPQDGTNYIIDDISSPSNSVTVSLTSPIKPTNNYSTTPRVYMVILPGVHTGDVKIGVESGGVFKEVVKTNVTFIRGKKYIVKVDAAKAEIPVIKGSDLEPVKIGNLIWAPVNLGYSPSLTMGALYQWHRTFGNALTINSTLKASDFWSIDLDQETAEDKYREVYLNNASDPYDWMPIRHIEWNQSRKFNPCPEGWRVPTKSDFSNLMLNGFTTITSITGGGVDGALGKWIGPYHDDPDLRTTKAIFLPLTGYFRQNSTVGAARTSLDSYGLYWASTTGGTNNKSADYVQFTSSVSAPTISYTGKCNAYAIRCVKDVSPQSSPILYTIKPYDVKNDRAKVGGFIEYQGDSPVTERGIFWGTTVDPATNKIVASGTGVGEYIVDLAGLEELKTYYVRAYVKTSAGTTYYGDQYKFRPLLAADYNGQEVTINGVTWAPWNAGYSDTNPYGLLYQWHRKYGQPYEGTVTTKTPMNVSGANYYSNKDIFFWYNGSDYKYDCLNPQIQTSWDMAVEYNPCPVGWRVPTESEMLSLIESGHSWTDSGPNGMKGRWFGENHAGTKEGCVFLPAAGYRDVTIKSALVRNTSGFYWTTATSYVSNTYVSICVIFTNSQVQTNQQYRGMGYSVRCVKE